MDNILVEALQISGVGIVVLLIALVLLAGLVSLMTKYIVDKPEEQEEEVAAEGVVVAAPASTEKKDLQMVAAVAVALYRSQLALTSSTAEDAGGATNSWLQFKLNRRLNQSATLRRTR